MIQITSKIAMREDGTSESTNPEALKMREQAIKSTIESYEQNRKLIAADVATLRNEIARLDAARVKEIEQLKLEAGRLGLGIIDAHLRGRAELEPEVFRLGSERMALMVERDAARNEVLRLESELKAANDELQKRPPLSTRGQLEQELSGLWDIRRSEQGVISRLRTEVLEAQEARDRFKAERDTLRCKLAAVSRALAG